MPVSMSHIKKNWLFQMEGFSKYLGSTNLRVYQNWRSIRFVGSLIFGVYNFMGLSACITWEASPCMLAAARI